jgi:hypothetical protein
MVVSQLYIGKFYPLAVTAYYRVLAGGVYLYVVKMYIPDNGVRAAFHHTRAAALYPEIRKTQISQSRQRDSVFHVHLYGILSAGNDYIGKQYIRNVRTARVSRWQVNVGVAEQDPVVFTVDNQVGKGTVADHPVAWAAHAHTLTGTFKHAVGHGNVLTHRRGIIELLDGTQDQAVILGVKTAVAYGHVAAGVQVYAIYIAHAPVPADSNPVDVHSLALHQPQGPAG